MTGIETFLQRREIYLKEKYNCDILHVGHCVTEKKKRNKVQEL